jgi:hypothetical protein
MNSICNSVAKAVGLQFECKFNLEFRWNRETEAIWMRIQSEIHLRKRSRCNLRNSEGTEKQKQSECEFSLKFNCESGRVAIWMQIQSGIQREQRDRSNLNAISIWYSITKAVGLQSVCKFNLEFRERSWNRSNFEVNQKNMKVGPLN